MFVPFIFTLDTHEESGQYYHWRQFYIYADLCIANKWPIISHQRYFERLMKIEDNAFGVSLKVVADFFGMQAVPTTETMNTLKDYRIPQVDEDQLIAKYPSPHDCWVNLLEHDNHEFTVMIGTLIDKIILDSGEKPEGFLVYEYLPQSLLKAANERGIPVIFQAGGVLRPPLTEALNAFCLLNDNSSEHIKERYSQFLSEADQLPMLSHKGILRLFLSQQYLSDIHKIDEEPTFEIGVLHNNIKNALFHVNQTHVLDCELNHVAQQHFNKILVRTRPFSEPDEESIDDSPTCFHFCLKCKRVLSHGTKGAFEVILARRIPYELGRSFFHAFTNSGLDLDSDSNLAEVGIEFINYILFGLCVPYPWIKDPDYLRLLINGPTESDLYLNGFNHYTKNISMADLDFYYRTSGREYRLGDTLFFSNGHLKHQYASYYSSVGLGMPDGTHTWSEGKFTEFEFDLVEIPNENLILSVSLYTLCFDVNQADGLLLTVLINDQLCEEIKVTPIMRYLQFKIPSELLANKLNVKFVYGNSQCVNVGDQTRHLALAFEAMRINVENSNPFEKAMLVQNQLFKDEIERQVCTAEVLKQEVLNYVNQVHLLNEEVLTYKDRVVRFESETTTLNNQITLLNKDISTLSEDCIATRAALENSEMKITLTELELERVNLELERVKLELAESESELAESESELAESESALAESESELMRVELELANIKNSKVYKHMVEPIWKISTKIKNK